MALPWAVGVCLMVVIGTGCLAPFCACMSVSNHNYLVDKIRTLINSDVRNDEYGVPFKSYVPLLVRLAFHQCMSGVCDGCINIQDSNNNHILLAILSLETIRNDAAANHSINVSRADLMALAGVVALNVAEELAFSGGWQPTSSNYTSSIRFRYGRSDCELAPYSNDYLNFPQKTGGIQHVIYWFQTYLQLTVIETVAIMGLHKLGGLRRGDNADIYAQWTYAPDVLDNSYYRELSDASLGWKARYENVSGYSSPYYIWRQQPNNNRIMFNCDMALYKDLRFESCNPTEVTCTYQTCPRTYLTGNIVQQFAEDNGYWMQTMCKAFQKMIEAGYNDGDLYVPSP